MNQNFLKKRKYDDSTQSFNLEESQSDSDNLSHLFESDDQSFVDKVIGLYPSKKSSVNDNQMIPQSNLLKTF